MKMRKHLAMLLVLLLVVSILAACSNDKTPDTDATNTTEATQVTESETETTQEEAKTVSILVWDLGADGMLPIGDNYWTDYIQSEFGDPNNINVEWVSMPRTEEVTTLNVWMAGQEAPDIVYTYNINVVSNYISQEGLTDLTDVLGTYGPNIVSLIGNDVLDYGVFNGRQMCIPTLRQLPGIVGSSIRGDWLDALNMDVPTTTEEWYDTMVAFRDQDPGNLGELNIPCGMAMAEISFGYFNMLYSFVNPELTSKDLTLTYPFLYDGYKDGVKFVNKCYNEGLISPEFALDSDISKLNSDITNGYVGFFTQNVLTGYNNGGMFDSLAENVDGAYYLACDPFTNSLGKHPKLSNQPYGKFLMIPAFSEAVTESVMYLNWLADVDNYMYIQFGEEGKHYTYEDGIFHQDTNYAGEDKLSAYNNYEIRILVEGEYYGDTETSMLNKTASYDDPQASIQYGMSMTDIRLDPWFFPYFKEPVASEAQYSTSMKDKYKEIFTQLYMCSPDEFDSLYDQLVEEFMTMYGNEVCAERAEVWANTME